MDKFSVLLIQPYYYEWVDAFQKIRQVLFAALSDVQVRIEHVGSTAVEGLAAKPIIDIDIVFDSNATIEVIENRLTGLGYRHEGDQGIKDREVFKRAGQHHPVLDNIHHHLYVCPSHSEEFARHLKFRDHLRNHPESRVEYEQLKRSIAEAANQDRKLYAALKEVRAKEFIEAIISKE